MVPTGISVPRPTADATLARGPVTAPPRSATTQPPSLLQRCAGATCTCGGTCASAPVANDPLTPLLREAVQERALRRSVLQAPQGLLQRACTRSRLASLQSSMHSWCDSGISCRGNLDCGTIDDRWNAGRRCLSLRQQIQDECYDGNTDAGHAEQIATVRNAIDFCDYKWNQQRC